ncbi:MAG: hypothetical protein LBD22_04490 [Spirochaetaceae bacterium]|nr:hypothetical protein [Spirochaetaceae bacterium]
MLTQFNGRPGSLALGIRSLALFGILIQIHLIAGDLSDAPNFFAAVVCAFVAGYALSLRTTSRLTSVLSLLLAPFAARIFIAMPRLLTGGNLTANILFDSLLLTYDRNHFVSMLPFYYAALTTFFAATQKKALRSAVLGDGALIVLVFSLARSASLEIYRLPIVLLSVFAFILFLELSALLLSLPAEYAASRKEKALSFALLGCVMLLGAVFLLFEAQRGRFDTLAGDGAGGGESAAAGNGLMKPGLFSFDMTPYLNLHTEVAMQNDLIFIVRKEVNDESHIFMRRFVLSAYNSDATDERAAGFTRSESIDEKNQRNELPSGSISLTVPEYKKREPLHQEYYIKNIDGSAFLAMNEPERVLPYENYDTSSFKTVYAVESMVSTATPLDLYKSALVYRDNPCAGMSEDAAAWYTAWANGRNGATPAEERIQHLAESLTAEYYDVFSKSVVLFQYLAEGEYRYSLKPGIAPDGDQLSYFLFDTKRGYCSYFALAYASMLRALKIPSRVVIGFYLDPDAERLGLYPVRSSNAHAWVEIYFPEYGWIEFDPTAKQYAEDELQPVLGDMPDDNFERLMKEILENRGKLKAKSNIEDAEENNVREFIKQAVEKARSYALPVIALLLAGAILFVRYKNYLFSRTVSAPRHKTIYIWRHIKFRLRLKGYTKNTAQTEGEWAAVLPQGGFFAALYNEFERARYAPEYRMEDAEAFISLYREFCSRYRVLTRRSLRSSTTHLIVLMGITLFISQDAAWPQEENLNTANSLYRAAEHAEDAQYWERAVSLYNQGKVQYPDDWRFPAALGELYYHKQLYKLAQEEYRAALSISGDNSDIIYKLANTSGNLNEYKKAASYYEWYLSLIPDDYKVISELGWVYYKLHRLREGETLLAQAIETHGAQPHLAMTLATIYSDMLDYDDGSRWYNEAISSALRGDVIYPELFASTAWYNYAILESRFYNYEKSFEFAQYALQMADRDTGHMMRGELYLRRLDWQRSFAEYTKAFELDQQSPLPKVSLAQNYLISGRLEEARLYAEDCFKATNHAWMFRFGIDPAQYARDLHDILYKTYSGLYHKETFKSYSSAQEKFDGLLKKIEYYFKYIVHKKLFEKNALLTARSYKINEMGGQYIDALSQYYMAFNEYRYRAAFYLKRASEYEFSLIPASLPTYNYEEGRLSGNIALLDTALAGFDPVWERDMTASALAELAKAARNAGRRDKAREAATALYLLNPGALIQNGITLPVTLKIEGAERRDERKLQKALRTSGFDTRVQNASLTLIINIDGDAARWTLVNNNAQTILIRGSAPLTFTASGFARFTSELSASLFTAH